MFKEVAAPLIRSEQRRGYAFWLVLDAVIYGAVAPGTGIRMMARAALPKGLRVKARSLWKGSTNHRR